MKLPALVRLCTEKEDYQGHQGPIIAETLEWLEEQSVISGITAESLGPMSIGATPTAESFRVQINEAVNHYIEDRERADVPVSVNEVGSGDFIGDVMARAIALGLRDRKGLDAVSTITPHTLVDKLVSSGLGLSGVARVILDGLPIPDESTAWEAIIEFRNDSTSMNKLLRLRRWMNQMATGSIDPRHMDGEIEWLLHEYEEHMRLHQLKINKGTLEMIVTLAAGLLEDVVKLKFRDAAGLLFERTHRKVALMEAERNAPGREVAYLSRVRSFFGKK